MANTVPTDDVQARWAYSELPSKNFGHFYNAPGVQELRDKSVQKVPFEVLAQEELNLLVREFNEVRGGYFNRYFTGVAAFQLVHWSKDQLGAVYVIPWCAQDRLGVKSATFKQWAETEPYGAPSDRRGPFVQDHPVTAGQDAGRTVLLDGYHRAYDLWNTNDLATTLAVFVPS